MESRLRSLLDDLLLGGRFLFQVPAALRHPMRVEEARAILRRRLENRERDFLGLARRAIYEVPANPYRELLRLAGCAYGDLERLVVTDGVEGALRTLFRAGVYLSVDEFKGRRPARRGAATVDVNLHGLRNPRARAHIPGQTSGSRGSRAAVPIDLAAVRDWAVDECLDWHARGAGSWIHARWAVPGGGSIAFILMHMCNRTAPVRWFSPIDPGSSELHWRYRWATRALSWGSRLAGLSLPLPEHVSFEQPHRILRWLADTLRAGATPCLVAYASFVVRVCEVAVDAGIELTGAHAITLGEPLTAARLTVIRRAGVSVTPYYASVDVGPMGKGCLAAEAPDDVHLLHDLIAPIQPGGDADGHGLPPHAILVSSLRDTSSLVLLNVSTGDQGVLSERRCGCPLQSLGWTTHLHTIRSFEKLSAGGMTFLDRDIIRVLEEVLPTRFGGSPTHYQLVEDTSEPGPPALRLLVHPEVGSLDPEAVAAAFLEAIGGGSGVERIMGMVWRDAKLLRVERRPPFTTASGKVLHVHVERPGPDRA